MKPYFITTAIDYTNAPPHIGHAYEKIVADVLARYQRLRGREVFFMTGVDQHGQKVQQAAEKQKVSPQFFADEISKKFLELWDKLSISYDAWAATTDPKHKAVVQQILTNLHKSGWLYKASYEGFYSIRQEQFLTDKERDEEGNFGAEWGEVIFLKEENWYFRLSECRTWLEQFLAKYTDFVTPSFRQSELKNAAAKITGDLCISRPKSRLEWGIELPFDTDFVTYVWFDALINYISFAGYQSGHSTETAKSGVAPVLTASSTSSTLLCSAPATSCSSSVSANAQTGSDVVERSTETAKSSVAPGLAASSASQRAIEREPDFSKLWPCNYHLIGKDIMVPAHGVYWPCMLHAMGFSEEQMPRLLVHGFWTMKGEKISKSTGNVFDLTQAIADYSASALRYYLMRDVVMGRDADFNEERLLSRYHSELSNGLGNLLNRTVSMIHRYRPEGFSWKKDSMDLPEECLRVLQENLNSLKKYCEEMEASQIQAGLEEMVAIINRTNSFVDVMAPWKVAKNPAEAELLDAILITLVQSTRAAATLLMPVAPVAANSIFEQLQLTPLSLMGEIIFSPLPEKYIPGIPKPLFPRIEVKEK